MIHSVSSCVSQREEMSIDESNLKTIQACASDALSTGDPSIIAVLAEGAGIDNAGIYVYIWGFITNDSLGISVRSLFYSWKRTAAFPIFQEPDEEFGEPKQRESNPF
jgi:hypothetical protein